MAASWFQNVDRQQLEQQLDEFGFARIPNLLPPSHCRQFIDHYSQDEIYRSTVTMARHNFGEGQYRYFAYPLPKSLADLRAQTYQLLVPVARRWASALDLPMQFPSSYEDYTELCHAAGQTRPTPLILRYGAGDYNRLHQDIYGEWVFPLQLVVMLSSAKDYDGGELVLTEQRPRTQSRAHVLSLAQGEAVVMAVNIRPRLGVRGYHRVALRHGVSTIRRGERFTLGVILHDAQ